MTGLVRKATLLSVCGLLAASAALANVPDPSQCTVPSGIRVVGQQAGVPSPVGTYTVVVRDIGGTAIPNAQVVIDFSARTDLVLCSTQLDGSTVDCGLKTVRKFTDALGSVTFDVLGGSTAHNGILATAPASIEVFAAGVLIGTIRGAAYDLNNVGGASAADLAIWLADAAPPAKARADYDYTTTVGAPDLALWLAGAATQATSCGTPCP
jgi:hypothetical protein